MKAGWLGVLAAIAACAPESGVRRAEEDVQREEREAAQEVGKAERDVSEAAREGREEIGEAKRDLMQELRDAERSGEAVEMDAVVTGHDADTVMVRLPDGQAFEVDYGPATRFRRGTEIIAVTELQSGTPVHVVYRLVDGRRMIDQIDITEGATTPGTNGMPGGDMGGGTR